MGGQLCPRRPSFDEGADGGLPHRRRSDTEFGEAGIAHRRSGDDPFFAGEYREAREHLKHALALFHPGRDDDLTFGFRLDPAPPR